MTDKEFIKRFISSLVIVPVSLFFIIFDTFLFLFFLSFLFLISSYEWIKMNKKKKLNLIIGNIFLFFSFYTAYELRNFDGVHLFIFIITISVFTDLGGYVFGKLIKGPKLTKISPNKTYAGLIGGLILSLISGSIYYDKFLQETNVIYLVNILNNIDYKNLNIYSLIILISIISQIGDFIISYFKRLSKVKDTGKILPGHGGLLDRIDGIIFAIPFFYILIIF